MPSWQNFISLGSTEAQAQAHYKTCSKTSPQLSPPYSSGNGDEGGLLPSKTPPALVVSWSTHALARPSCRGYPVTFVGTFPIPPWLRGTRRQQRPPHNQSQQELPPEMCKQANKEGFFLPLFLLVLHGRLHV